MNPLVLAVFGGLLYFGKIEVASFERDAARELATTLSGPEKRVEVQAKVGPESLWGDLHSVSIKASKFSADGLPLFTEPRRSHYGMVRNLTIELTDFSVRDLHIESLKAEIPDNRFDFALAVKHREFRLTRSGEGTGEVVVSAQDLADFILKKYKYIKTVKVEVTNDKMFVSGYGDFGFFKANFLVVAKFEPVDGSKLMLTFAKISFDGFPIDDSKRDAVLKVINPVVDLDRDLGLHGALYVNQLILRDGLIRALGKATIPERNPGVGQPARIPKGS